MSLNSAEEKLWTNAMKSVAALGNPEIYVDVFEKAFRLGHIDMTSDIFDRIQSGELDLIGDLKKRVFGLKSDPAHERELVDDEFVWCLEGDTIDEFVSVGIVPQSQKDRVAKWKVGLFGETIKAWAPKKSARS